MKKVKEIYYIDNREERASDFSTGFVFILEDGSKIETMTTDTITERYTIDTNPFNLGHSKGKSANTGELYKCPSYIEKGKVIDCNCGKCMLTSSYQRRNKLK